jgi:L-malate glycosyltransferase
MCITSTNSINKISIVRVVFEFYPIVGGSATHIMELSKKINPYLKNQTIIVPEFDGQSSEFDKNFGITIVRAKSPSLRKIGIIPVLPLKYLLYSFNVYFKIKKIKDVDIIHAHGISNIAFCVIMGKILKIPVIGMIHGSGVAYSKISGLYETILAKLFKPDYAFVLDDGSIALNKFRSLWTDKVKIVYHGIDTDLFRSTSKNNDLIEKLGLNRSSFIILSTSSLIPVKNIDLLIKSFYLFLQNYGAADAYLLIIGEGSLKESLIHLAEKLNIKKYVKFIGEIPQEEVIEYLNIANIVVATSLYSNMNRSVLEAMAAEKPVITFNSGRTEELLCHMDNGILVKPGDLLSFAENLNALYKNRGLCVKLGKNARNTVMSERSWKIRVKTELNVYEGILSRKNGK